jgi:transposase
VPWAVVTDNMKTAVLGRDEHHQPIWNPAYQKLAVEFKFHPDVCEVDPLLEGAQTWKFESRRR